MNPMKICRISKLFDWFNDPKNTKYLDQGEKN